MKRRRSGNGTNARQWVYILWNIPFVWVVKIGITGSLFTRWNQIDKSAPGWDIPVFFLPVWFAYDLEQWMHKIFSPFRVRFRGSGRTERFFALTAIPAAVIILAVFLIEWGVLIVAGVAFFWVMAGMPEIA